MQRRDISDHARHYLTGRKRIGRIEEELPDSRYQGLQQFISDSPWDDRALLQQVRGEAEALLGRHRDTALYLDETSFAKKGAASVGVPRQDCGRLGKLENCQVGVFACLGRGDRAAAGCPPMRKPLNKEPRNGRRRTLLRKAGQYCCAPARAAPGAPSSGSNPSGNGTRPIRPPGGGC
jgi:hypothetical protein